MTVCMFVCLTVAAPARALKPGAEAKDDYIGLSAFDGEQGLRSYTRANTPAAIQLFQLRRAALCNVTSGTLEADIGGACAPPDGSVVPSCDGEEPVQPLWRRDRATPDTPWEPWRMVVGWACPDDLLPTMTAEDFRQLPIAPPGIQMQPDRGWVLVNKETIVLTDPAEQAFRTDLFGYGVDVVATPERWTWDFGDGTRDLSTDSPGHPYPDFDVFHVYAEPDTAVITLTTTWSGRYRVDGDATWREVVGTAETTSTSPAFEIVERRSHLVSADCNEDPDQPGCG
ncbi:hypothetical protein [uncultured Cellulomonas sp.]|uniref:hypothetical protein n=1 Tax=uncultured Cellulomonas sp. TaxID=189682 RepID=UPI0028F0C1F9|nr:hypothetical protein [uncultured Cellulomonas sp.]